MIENCALYFPTAELPLQEIFPTGRFEADWFEFATAQGTVRLNLKHDDLERHLQGFRGYVAQQPNSGAAIARAQQLIAETKTLAGVELPQPVEPDSETFGSLVHLIQQLNGFMFVANSIMLADGSFLVGPMAEEDDEEAGEPEIYEVDPNDYRHECDTTGADPNRVAMRERHYCQLAERGFYCTRWLPLYREEGEERLRPTEEIFRRLKALNILFLYVSAPDEIAPTEQLQQFFDNNPVEEHLTEEENAIRLLPREQAREEHEGSIGWRLENMWALAWILGFEPAPPFYQGQLPQEIIREVVLEFTPSLDPSNLTVRSVEEVVALEDLYYCAHNAVRSAQMGEATVPDYFHPLRDGGAIHERRHALTWALSPEVDWENTDLST